MDNNRSIKFWDSGNANTTNILTVTSANNVQTLNGFSSGAFQLGISNASNTTGYIQFLLGNSEKARLDPSGNLGLGTSSPLAALDVRSNTGTVPTASISGQTSFAALTVDNSGVGDLFTASSSGLSRFVITQGGNVGYWDNIPT